MERPTNRKNSTHRKRPVLGIGPGTGKVIQPTFEKIYTAHTMPKFDPVEYKKVVEECRKKRAFEKAVGMRTFEYNLHNPKKEERKETETHVQSSSTVAFSTSTSDDSRGFYDKGDMSDEQYRMFLGSAFGFS